MAAKRTAVKKRTAAKRTAVRKRTAPKAAKKSARRKTTPSARKYVPPSARRVRGGLKCPDCVFVAKHAMGLGRHRSSRHGVASKRSARAGAAGGRWLTREQAAERAEVHYNTIRHWERAGLVKTAKRPGVRGILLSGDDLERFLVERGGYRLAPTSDASAAAVSALQARYDRLIGDLEKLLEAAKAARPSTRGSRKAKRGGPRGGKPRARARAKPRAKARAKPRARARPRR